MPFRTPSPRKRSLKRPREVIQNSSDTENTPPAKKTRKERVRAVKRPECDLAELLHHLLSDPSDTDAVADLKGRNNGEQHLVNATHSIVDNVKAVVGNNIEREGKKILEVELYLQWLEGLAFVIDAMDTVLNAKVPGTRRRVPGLGKVAFALLYHLLDVFIDEVNAHQDGWSFRYPAGPIAVNPLVMSLAEEANDPSTDVRSDDAVQSAEKILTRYDGVMVVAVRRYKSECNKKLMANSIGRKEESLGKGCCLLSEQTGFGGTEDMAFNLLVQTREAMTDWKNEFDGGYAYDTDYC